MQVPGAGPFCHYSIRSTKPNTFPPPPMPLQTRNKLSISILLPYPMQPFFVSTSFHAASPSRFVNIDPYRPSLHRHSPGPTLNFSKPSPSHPHIHLLLQSRHPLLNLNCKARLITSVAWPPKRAQHYRILIKWGVWVRNFFSEIFFLNILGTVNEVPEKKFPEIGPPASHRINAPRQGSGLDAFGAIEFTIISFALTLKR